MYVLRHLLLIWCAMGNVYTLWNILLALHRTTNIWMPKYGRRKSYGKWRSIDRSHLLQRCKRAPSQPYISRRIQMIRYMIGVKKSPYKWLPLDSTSWTLSFALSNVSSCSLCSHRVVAITVVFFLSVSHLTISNRLVFVRKFCKMWLASKTNKDSMARVQR